MNAVARYKVKLPDDDTFERALRLLKGRVPVFVSSPKRHFLSVGELGVMLRYRLRRLGGSLTPEYRYDLENHTPGSRTR